LRLACRLRPRSAALTAQAIERDRRDDDRADHQAGFRIDTLLACGGDTKNALFLREHADATGCRILLPAEPEAVLLGAAVLGAVASGDQPSVIEAMAAMNRVGGEVAAQGGDVARYHAQKHQVFQRMYYDQCAYGALMRA
jgi:ribulose kinase